MNPFNLIPNLVLNIILAKSALQLPREISLKLNILDLCKSWNFKSTLWTNGWSYENRSGLEILKKVSLTTIWNKIYTIPFEFFEVPNVPNFKLDFEPLTLNLRLRKCRRIIVGLVSTRDKNFENFAQRLLGKIARTAYGVRRTDGFFFIAFLESIYFET